MREVIFDSSFLMAVVERPTTWFDDMTKALGRFRPILLECVAAELENLAAQKGRRARTARVALEITKNFDRAGCGEAEVDDEIISSALHRKAVVATADRSLARTLEGLHLQTAGLRSGRVNLKHG